MDYLSQILSFLGGLLSGWSLKFLYDKSSNRANLKNNKAGRDIAGRDINHN